MPCPLLRLMLYSLKNFQKHEANSWHQNLQIQLSVVLAYLCAMATTAPRPQVSKQWVLFISQVSSWASHDILPLTGSWWSPQGSVTSSGFSLTAHALCVSSWKLRSTRKAQAGLLLCPHIPELTQLLQNLLLPHPDSGFQLARGATLLCKGHCTPVIA